MKSANSELKDQRETQVIEVNVKNFSTWFSKEIPDNQELIQEFFNQKDPDKKFNNKEKYLYLDLMDKFPNKQIFYHFSEDCTVADLKKRCAEFETTQGMQFDGTGKVQVPKQTSSKTPKTQSTQESIKAPDIKKITPAELKYSYHKGDIKEKNEAAYRYPKVHEIHINDPHDTDYANMDADLGVTLREVTNYSIDFETHGCDLFLMSQQKSGYYKKSDQNNLYLYKNEKEQFVFRIQDSVFNLEIPQSIKDKKEFKFEQPEIKPIKCENLEICTTVLGMTSKAGHTQTNDQKKTLISATQLTGKSDNKYQEDIAMAFTFNQDTSDFSSSDWDELQTNIYKKLNQKISNNKQFDNSGACLTTAIIANDEIHIANAGDCVVVEVTVDGNNVSSRMLNRRHNVDIVYSSKNSDGLLTSEDKEFYTKEYARIQPSVLWPEKIDENPTRIEIQSLPGENQNQQHSFMLFSINNQNKLSVIIDFAQNNNKATLVKCLDGNTEKYYIIGNKTKWETKEILPEEQNAIENLEFPSIAHSRTIPHNNKKLPTALIDLLRNNHAHPFGLQPTRSIGDKYYQNSIDGTEIGTTAEPDCTHTKITEKQTYLFICSDGAIDHGLNLKEIGNIVKECHDKGESVDEMSQQIAVGAYFRKTTDNITVNGVNVTEIQKQQTLELSKEGMNKPRIMIGADGHGGDGAVHYVENNFQTVFEQEVILRRTFLMTPAEKQLLTFIKTMPSAIREQYLRMIRTEKDLSALSTLQVYNGLENNPCTVCNDLTNDVKRITQAWFAKTDSFGKKTNREKFRELLDQCVVPNDENACQIMTKDATTIKFYLIKKDKKVKSSFATFYRNANDKIKRKINNIFNELSDQLQDAKQNNTPEGNFMNLMEIATKTNAKPEAVEGLKTMNYFIQSDPHLSSTVKKYQVFSRAYEMIDNDIVNKKTSHSRIRKYQNYISKNLTTINETGDNALDVLLKTMRLALAVVAVGFSFGLATYSSTVQKSLGIFGSHRKSKTLARNLLRQKEQEDHEPETKKPIFPWLFIN